MRERVDKREVEREKVNRARAYPSPFLRSLCPVVSRGTPRIVPTVCQPGSHRAKPGSQSGVRISLRGSNVSAEGLLDGSSSDNSQARRARCYTLERKRDVERGRERKMKREREREKVRKREFRFRAHAPPYKGRTSLLWAN